jgi:hypothetical protein
MELTKPSTSNPKAPWSPMGIAVLTLFFSPFVGGILHGLNYGRLGQPAYRRFVLARNLLAGGLLVLFANLIPMQSGLGIVAGLFFAAYFYKTQERSFESHRSQGGRKASFLLPVVLCLAVVVVLGVLYALFLFLP